MYIQYNNDIVVYRCIFSIIITRVDKPLQLMITMKVLF